MYEFTGTAAGVPMGPLTFTLTVATPLTADATFAPGANLVCNLCTGLEVYVDAEASGLGFSPSQAFGYALGSATFYFYFPVGSFTTNGVYPSTLLTGINDGVLTVSISGGDVPEPATLSVMLAGLAGLLVVARRRRSIGW